MEAREAGLQADTFTTMEFSGFTLVHIVFSANFFLQLSDVNVMSSLSTHILENSIGISSYDVSGGPQGLHY